MTVPNCVKKVRKEKGLSLNDLAVISKLGKNTINKIERGESYPTQKSIVKLSYALKTEACILFDLDYKHMHLWL